MPVRTKLITMLALVFLCGCQPLLAQTANKSINDLFQEVENFEAQKRAAIVSQGRSINASDREGIANDRRSLAKKYAAEASSRPGLKGEDYYYIGRLYAVADNEQKTYEMMQKVVAEFPPDATGSLIQSALSHIVIISSKMKHMDIAESALGRWSKGQPI